MEQTAVQKARRQQTVGLSLRQGRGVDEIQRQWRRSGVADEAVPNDGNGLTGPDGGVGMSNPLDAVDDLVAIDEQIEDNEPTADGLVPEAERAPYAPKQFGRSPNIITFPVVLEGLLLYEGCQRGYWLMNTRFLVRIPE